MPDACRTLSTGAEAVLLLSRSVMLQGKNCLWSFIHLRQLDDIRGNAMDLAAGIAGDIAGAIVGSRSKDLGCKILESSIHSCRWVCRTSSSFKD